MKAPRTRRQWITALLVVGGLAPISHAVRADAPTQPQASADPTVAISNAITQAEAALRAGEVQLAESAYRSALLEGWLLLGDLEAAYDPEASVRAYTTASTVAVDIRRPLTALALAHLRADRPQPALDAIRRLLVRDPRDLGHRRLLAQALVTADQNAQAVQELKELVDAHPGDLETAFSLANGYLRVGDVDAAAELFERLATERPIPQTHVLIGRTYRDFEHYDRAREALRQALAMDATVRRAHYYLGTVELQGEGRLRLAEAIDHFSRELELAPDDPLTNLFLGMALVEERRFDEAVGPLEIARRSPLSRIDASYFYGRALLGSGQPAQAIEPFAEAVELGRQRSVDPVQLQSLHYQLAQAYRRVGREDDARIHFEAAQQNTAESTADARERLDDYLQGAITRNAVPPAMIVPLDVPTAARLDATARQDLQGWLRRTMARAYLNLGIPRIQGQRFASAAHLFSHAAELTPEDPQVQRSLGIARFNAGQFADAVAPLTRTVDATPNDLDARRLLALAHLNTKAYEPAAELLRDAGLRGQDPSLHYAFGMALVRSGRTDEAQRIFDQLLSANANWPELRVLLGQAKAQDGDFDGAIAELELAIGLDPTVAEAHGALGVIHLRRGELEKARGALEQELEHHPGDVRSRFNLATVLELSDRAEDAEGHLRMLLASHPSDADARYLLGKILLAGGHPVEATAQLEAAVELAPEDPNIHYQLGQAYQKQGQRDRARQQFERFQALKKAQRSVPSTEGGAP